MLCQLHKFSGPFSLGKKLPEAFTKTCCSPSFFPGVEIIIFMEDFWFMQNGATPHRTRPVSSLLNRTFHGRLLGLGYPSEYECGFNWPRLSPDINACNHFVWGFLTDRVYRQQFQTIADFNAAIQNKSWYYQTNTSWVSCHKFSKSCIYNYWKERKSFWKTLLLILRVVLSRYHMNNCGINPTEVINDGNEWPSDSLCNFARNAVQVKRPTMMKIHADNKT